ncbi:MAG: TrmH family RNA methyltransferase, partial [Paludibacteraceae bacterium]|nr:TrmH family RNA methyltransferase [Paludibacteraceae bacterium]
MSRKLDTEEIIRISTDEFKQTKKIPLVVVLDNVRSMHNIGSVFRTSDAYVVEKVVLCGITAQPPHPDIHKSALGAEFSVDWEYYANTNEAVAALKSQGYEVWAIELAENSVMLQDFFNHHTDSHPNSEESTENENTHILSPSFRGTSSKSGGGSQLSTLNSQLSTKYAVVLGNEVKG